MTNKSILEFTLYFTALINPFSKIFFLTAYRPALSPQELLRVSVRSNFIAWIVLMVLLIIGDFLFTEVFKIELYSLNVAGGIVLFTLGLRVVNTGYFVKESTLVHHEDIALVPLAIPLIVGPGIITAVITVAASTKIWIGILCVTLALLLNLLGMLFAPYIQRGLFRLHATEAFVRIMGLIIATMGIQMILSGGARWVEYLKSL